ncbi:hypothetical protein [Streptococcus oriscaviae]|uniref:Uncharacterized protein n=1 Tax=Streptococcus oriscaviae TaxID=2781599 RepID=A0ABX7YLR8_9STRE|nr:hypothetical protein [Streptococcus oriscaviae]QUE54760.1 hypothetical protein INT76_02415 [Streptococcus oriscaviae]
MENKLLYELPMFSTLLSESPRIEFKGMDVYITLKGYDCDDNFFEVTLKFYSVFQFVKTYSHFEGPPFSYDRVEEVTNSKILTILEERNSILFEEIKKEGGLKHFILLLDSDDSYQIICKSFEVLEL